MHPQRGDNLDKTFEEAIYGIRHAERGVEVREDIAQGMEYVESFARTAVSASAAASASEANAENSYQNAKAQVELSAQHEQAAKDQVTYATEQAAAAATSATASENSNIASGQKAEQADSFQKMAAKYLQSTKEYFEQVRTITIGAQGWYATPEALKAAVPVGENGWWAVVGTTDTIWTWDSDTNTWKDSVQKADLSDYLTQVQVKKLLEQYMPLRPATADQLGGVKVGDYLDIAPDGTLSGKTLNDKIAAAVAVKSEARLVWSQAASTPKKWMSHEISIPDGVDYLTLHAGASSEIQLARGGSWTYTYKATEDSVGSVDLYLTFRAEGTLHVNGPYTNSNYNGVVTFYLSGYHYPTIAELLTETQAAQADTDALAVDQEYRVAMLELGLTDDTTTDTTT